MGSLTNVIKCPHNLTKRSGKCFVRVLTERFAIFASDLIANEPYHHIVCIVSPFFGTCYLDMEDAGEEVDKLVEV